MASIERTAYPRLKRNPTPHIDKLFKDSIDWEMLKLHWQDLLQVVISMRTGKVLPSTLLRKLGNYSRKNRLYQAFRELGCVVRTAYLLKYISSIEVREQVSAETNKTETYNLVGNIVMFQNVVDMTYALRDIKRGGEAALHPGGRGHAKSIPQSPHQTLRRVCA